MRVNYLFFVQHNLELHFLLNACLETAQGVSITHPRISQPLNYH